MGIRNVDVQGTRWVKLEAAPALVDGMVYILEAYHGAVMYAETDGMDAPSPAQHIMGISIWPGTDDRVPVTRDILVDSDNKTMFIRACGPEPAILAIHESGV